MVISQGGIPRAERMRTESQNLSKKNSGKGRTMEKMEKSLNAENTREL